VTLTITILLAVVFGYLVGLVVWWVDRQTVEEPARVDHHPFVIVQVPYDWAERCPEWRPRSVVVTPEEWDAYLCVIRTCGGVA
jgi:hypothetical protein